MNHSQDISKGFLLAIGSAILFSIRPIFVKLVYAEQVSPLVLITWRMIFSMPIYACILFWLLRDPERRAALNSRNIILCALIGLFGYYIASYFDLLGLQYVSTQLGRIVLYAYPTLVVLMGALFFKEKITLGMVWSLIITYAGILLIFGHDLNSFGSDVSKGSLLILVSAASFACYLVFAKSLISQMGSRVFTSIALISASCAIFIQFGIENSLATNPVSLLDINHTGLFWIFVIAIFCTVIPTFMTAAAVSAIGPERTGIVAMVGPGFTSIFAVMILSEAFTLFHLGGIALTVYGVWTLHQHSQK